MSIKTPEPGQVVYVWSNISFCPVAVKFLERRRSWCYFERSGRRFSINGCPPWSFHASQCAWDKFRATVLAAGTLSRAGFRSDNLVEEAFSIACEYTRLFADSLGKECGEVQDERRSSARGQRE